MAEITNKRISKELIKKMVYALKDRYQYLYRLYEKYEEETSLYDNPKNSEVKNIVVSNKPSMEISVTMGDQTETFGDVEMLIDLLDNKSKQIESVRVNCYAVIYLNTTNNDCYKALRSEEDAYLYFREDSATIKFDFKNASSEYRQLKEEIEQLVNTAPDSYDQTIAKKYWRKNLPSLAIGLVFGLLLSIGLYTFCKISSVNIYINDFVLGNFYCLTAFLASLVLGLVVPGKNHSLYNALKIKQRYAGYSSYKKTAIYKDDIRNLKENAEVELGKNYNHGKIRGEIESNYAKSKRQVLWLTIMFVIFYIVTTII